ncbi:hypothetical protein [Streptomyces radicis]|uniref:hypothetical protein n=1 Tax=Streptomyces radicis TaxID=1750517 RepID=UPI0016004A42|nr:hypothetical protein [Streptomyces radicis]
MTIALARRAALYLLLVAVFAAVVLSPTRSAEFVALAFEAVSGAVDGVGDLVAR